MPKTMSNSNRSSTSSSSHNKQLPQSQLHATTTTTLMGTSVNATTTATTIHSNQSNHHSLHDECDVIGELMGKYGKYQFYMTFLLSLFQIPNTFHIASPVYQAADKTFWCKRPTHLNHIDPHVWRNLSHSEDNCNISNNNWTLIRPDEHSLLEALVHNTTSTTLSTPLTKCTAWEFDMNDKMGNTWISEWSLVCDSSYLRTFAETVFLLGVASGGVISGYLSDRFGRKRLLFLSVVLQTIFGFALYVPTSFRVHLVLRALLGVFSVSVTYAGLILAIEFVDGRWRTIAGMYNLFPLPVSYMIIAGIAYLTQDFRNLQLYIGIPGVFLCFLLFVIPESPRWLLCKGRTAEVAAIIKKACAVNKRELPANFEKLLKLPPPMKDENEEGCISLFATPYLRLITICFLCIWFTMNLVYYGLILNMNKFGGNVYFNSALAGLVEIPAIAITMLIIMKVGKKKWLFCSAIFCAGIACACTLINDTSSSQWMKITMLMLGKFTISASNTIMPVYTAELYPTDIRNAGVGAGNFAGGLALIIVPYLSELDNYLMALLAAFCLFGSFVVIFLPESMVQQQQQQQTKSTSSQHSSDDGDEERAYVFSA